MILTTKTRIDKLVNAAMYFVVMSALFAVSFMFGMSISTLFH